MYIKYVLLHSKIEFGRKEKNRLVMGYGYLPASKYRNTFKIYDKAFSKKRKYVLELSRMHKCVPKKKSLKMIIMFGKRDDIEYFNNSNHIKNTCLSFNKSTRTFFFTLFVFNYVIVKNNC